MSKNIVLVLFCFLPGILLAEDLVRLPTGPGSWTIDCTKKAGGTVSASAGGAPSQDLPKIGTYPQRIEVEQTEDATRSVVHWSNGRKQELWSVPKLDVILTEGPSGTPFVSKEKNLNGCPFAEPDFTWITVEGRVSDKPEKYNGVDCYHYKGSMELPSPFSQSKPIMIPCEAWIDAKTLAPLALLKDDVMGRFTYGGPPDSLTMPKKFQDKVKYYKILQGIP